MDENTNDQVVETLESDIAAEEDAAFDSGWEDNDSPDSFSENAEPESQEPDAQPESEDEGLGEEEPDEADDESADEADEAEPEEQGEAGSQRYNLKFLGEDRKVSFDEMREYAEKGLNYDHVKEERDALREKTKNLEELENAAAFLKELADGGGISVEELMESTRAKLLMQKAEREGRDLSDEEAREQVRANQKKKKEPAPETKTDEQMKREAVQRFVALYPGIKSEDIPQSVWDEADRTGDLIGPYQKYESQKLRDEIATLKQNQKNRERSTGSRRTVGATTPKDAFDEGWDS